MKKITFLLSILVVILMGVSASIKPMHDMNRSGAEKLRTAMHKLWEDHVTWTRNVIFNIMDDLPGTDQAVARLLKNQEDIGNAIKPLYGEAAGTELTRLLKEHITTAADLLKAAKNGDNASFNT